MQIHMNLRCPHCGQGIPPKLFVSGWVRPVILALIANRPDGISTREIAKEVYPLGLREPPSPRNIPLIIMHANKELKPQGYIIQPLCYGPGARWVLRKLEDAQPVPRSHADPKHQSARNQNAAGLDERTQSAGTAGLY